MEKKRIESSKFERVIFIEMPLIEVCKRTESGEQKLTQTDRRKTMADIIINLGI